MEFKQEDIYSVMHFLSQIHFILFKKNSNLHNERVLFAL